MPQINGSVRIAHINNTHKGKVSHTEVVDAATLRADLSYPPADPQSPYATTWDAFTDHATVWLKDDRISLA